MSEEVKKASEMVNPFKSKDFEEFSSLMGLPVTHEDVKKAQELLKISTIYGQVSMSEFEALVLRKIYEYNNFGVARKVWEIMAQNGGGSMEDFKVILLEMARLEIEYGLRPIVHTIPVSKSVYIKADGYLYYAKRSGQLKSIKWEDSEENGGWRSVCKVYVLFNDEVVEYEGIGFARPNPKVYSDDPREKARTQAMRRALRRAFPIGGSDEIYDEVNGVPQVVNHVSNLKDLKDGGGE